MNTKLFDLYLSKSKYNNDSLSKELGINRVTLFRKKTGKTDFSAPELEKVCKLLSIPKSKRKDVFFADKVS